MTITRSALPDLKAIQTLAAPDMTALDGLIRRRLSSDVVLINQVAEYIIGAGGKRLRPMLLLLVTGALGAGDGKNIGSDAHQLAAAGRKSFACFRPRQGVYRLPIPLRRV